MRKLYFLVVITCLILSCSSPEKEAEKIMKQFETSLNEIGDATNIPAQDLSRKIKTCRDNVDKLISSKRKEFTKSEEKERFDNVISIDDIEIYLSLRKELTEKSLKSLENVKGKRWINSVSSEASSIFTLDESCISFLNLKNKFNYALKDGDIVFDNDCDTNPLYFTFDGHELIITNGQGQTSKFREATFEEILQAKWVNSRFHDSGFILKKDGKGITFGELKNENITYTLKDKNITTVRKRKFYDDLIDHYKYLSNDKLQFTDYGEYGVSFFRKQEAGPDCLTFLFDGKIKSVVKTQTSFSSSKSDNDWDAVLDDYEKFVDQYIKLFKKAQNGDTSAITEYAECLEKAKSLQEKLENAKSDLTSKQASRLAKIINKFSNAITSAL